MSDRVVVAASVLCLAVLTAGCTPEKAPGPDAPPPRLAAPVTVEAQKTIRVPVTLTNPSAEVVTYGLDGDGGLYLLEGVLYRGGEKLKPNTPLPDLEPFRKEMVRELKPGKTVGLHYRLLHENLEPGEYELRLLYKVHPKSAWAVDFGFTPMELEQTILLNVRR